MWYRLKIAITKELLTYLRDPTTIRFLVGAPIFQVIIFSFAATLDVQNVNLAIFDQDAGRWSHELVARIDGAWFTDELIAVSSMDEVNELMSHRQILLALRITPEFSRDINAGLGGRIQVIVDGRRANAGQISTNYLNSIVAGLGAELAASNGGEVSVPEVSLRNWYNPNLHFRWFMVPSLSATMGMMLSIVITSLSIARERELGTFDQLLVSPVSPLEIIIAKIFPGFIAGMVVCILVTLIAVFVFGTPFNGSIVLYVLALAVFILSVVGVGLAISSICHTQQQAILGTFFGTIPFILTSGFATPVENMPDWLQLAAEINPLKHFLVITQGSFLKSFTASEVLANVWPLAIIAVVTLSAATLVVKRNLE